MDRLITISLLLFNSFSLIAQKENNFISIDKKSVTLSEVIVYNEDVYDIYKKSSL